MFILRGIGYLFLLIAVGLGIWEGVEYFTAEGATRLELAPIGKLWCEIDCTSLQVFQPAVERHLSPGLWQNFIQPWVLEPPAVVVFAVAGILFLVLAWLLGLPFRRRRKSGLIDRA